ncbi:MAG: Thiamine biosynthesis enzyme ThiH, FO synthase [Candidatus Methanohalarchaeum thermophilum]|uniref:7,8-didemethyl-8-hydroxy-5-deazariboflavin synthase n=1 Tax=Methanohalarchaeum thermophilum TaxID=1903181 RepID=A0A1Q6DTK0_METT1|nr:MAG: Thiamine biosynthesis enzyme ThiH, FO synthase [Candidatus Methanohalarchaeum thermophilum]
MEDKYIFPNKEQKIITYSKNVFIPVTNYCRNNCLYCGFNRGNRYLLELDEIEKLLDKAKKRNAKEVLLCCGERPEQSREFMGKIKEIGYDSHLEYLIDICKLALDKNLLPHTNTGLLDYNELKKLKRYNASMGLMLETTAKVKSHQNSPGKKPSKRIKMIKEAGKLQIPFTTGILLGIGESKQDRINSLRKIDEINQRYGHIQEVIIQRYEPNKYSKLKDTASYEELLDNIRLSNEILKDISIQSPPNLVRNLDKLVKAGIDDLGGISEVTSDYINPKKSWPDLKKIKLELDEFRVKERLPIYPRYIKEKWFSDELEETIKNLSDEDGYAK